MEVFKLIVLASMQACTILTNEMRNKCDIHPKADIRADAILTAAVRRGFDLGGCGGAPPLIFSRRRHHKAMASQVLL
jgi:hypothetical protein